MESSLDLNLLLALDALLDERSVGGAALRLHTSPPAMSRTLARLRRLLDDPILVRAGRTMVPTPRALTMQSQVHDLVEQARRLFTPPEQPDPATLRRTFSVQIGDLMFGGVGHRLLHRVHAEAPAVTLHFAAESHEDTHSLRDGGVDLELGSIRRAEPETHIEPLLRERMVGVARAGHPLLSAPVTPARYAATEHVVFSRRGLLTGPIDNLLAEHGLTRRVVSCAPSPASALFLLRDSDLVGTIAGRFGRGTIESLGLRAFEIPLPLPTVDLSMAWHPRHDADGAHRWLRQHVRAAVLDGVDG
ncbi:LysR substrate-binding domain-containing protein [Nocardia sp. BMG51109]|uniref:LysR substrate-binding domain-containing protein n=1 Tax=Nocardia sp. BMG51109 TaxID=1056816 RepID=UPI000465CCE9|nr:LysR substrate-binding domain-containing protein [Nocardia sp. BMG51109]